MNSTSIQTSKTEEKKLELKPFVITEKVLYSGAMSYDKIIESTISDPNGIINGITYKLQGSIAGCGLCTIHGVTNIMIHTSEKQNAFRECLIQNLQQSSVRTSTQQKGCLIATLGEMFITVHEPRILGVGFKKIHTYDNIAHTIGNDQFQSIYLLDIPRKQ